MYTSAVIYWFINIRNIQIQNVDVVLNNHWCFIGDADVDVGVTIVE